MTRKLLSDNQWSKIEGLLPGKASDRGVTAADNRCFVEAVLWVARTGSPWRDFALPAQCATMPVLTLPRNAFTDAKLTIEPPPLV